MVILEKGQFRLNTISRISNSRDGFCEIPVSEGLAIEKKCTDNSNSFYVICFVKYNKHEEAAGIENDTCGRLLNIETGEWKVFKSLYSTAKQLVEVANEELD